LLFLYWSAFHLIGETESLQADFSGKIREKHWSAVITYRGDKIRIISVRRSRIEEVQQYESN
jgi:uncharacterized DUF497 family protein